jgi:hypothetical protein
MLQRFDGCLEIWIELGGRTLGFWLGKSTGVTLYLPNCHSAASNTAGKLETFLCAGDCEQCAAVAGGELPILQEILNWLIEFQQSNRICDRCAVFSGAFGDLLLGNVKFFRETLEGAGLFDRVQILALEIFDQSHLERHFFGYIAHYDRNALDCSALGSAPAALSCN